MWSERMPGEAGEQAFIDTYSFAITHALERVDEVGAKVLSQEERRDFLEKVFRSYLGAWKQTSSPSAFRLMKKFGEISVFKSLLVSAGLPDAFISL
ncbi:MAG: hypothetical protein H7301_07620 [Cryobacterium sp.]|nr:hypothetical protein [Oligoflexia bacterium]